MEIFDHVPNRSYSANLVPETRNPIPRRGQCAAQAASGAGLLALLDLLCRLDLVRVTLLDHLIDFVLLFVFAHDLLRQLAEIGQLGKGQRNPEHPPSGVSMAAIPASASLRPSNRFMRETPTPMFLGHNC